MARAKIVLDHGGIQAILTGHCRAAVASAAAAVAANVEAHGRPVTTTSVTTDRAKVLVTLAHPAGMAMQAKYGS